MTKSAYIHIPFCKSKCKYCSFISFPNEDKIVAYVFSLLKDIDVNYSGEDLKTLYFGGGTPSLLAPEQLRKIINKFNLDKDCEITVEINPDDANYDYLKSLYEIGVNRLSVGSQSFNDKILQLIGRRHNSEAIVKAVKNDKGQEISLCAEVFLNQEKVEELGIQNVEETLKKDISKVTRELPVWKRVTKTEIRKTEFNKTTTNKIKR